MEILKLSLTVSTMTTLSYILDLASNKLAKLGDAIAISNLKL